VIDHLGAERLNRLYPGIATLAPQAWAEAFGPLDVHTLPAGQVLFEEGAPCRGFPLVLSGGVRVARGTPGGRTLELYRVLPGEVCVVSTACTLGRAPLQAWGQTLSMTEVAVLPPLAFDKLLVHEAFRRFVLGVFADRMADLMSLVEAVAFHKLDQRLALALLARGDEHRGTHQALADELGTVREIVTRLLRRFERAGWVELGRERVSILNVTALQAVADGKG
jgi:CRP/FNR family transcriptional regulator